ncbi:gamma-glutamylcyclotransferase [Amaricoccus sp.]|uniref:gamma-glutamylcyclotransferase n=1 Tax=Amaricoccus sp. TaxID=1872485 RepID=UPI00261C4401|nr:gamma-glutamylcyclotransferase [uncultured Amaricoccus sp.]
MRLDAGEEGGEGTWVFGYGSLIWNPGFPFAERRRAVLAGYARSFCMTSVHYRGTPERPGLVLALDREEAARCEGVAYRLAPETEAASLAYLRERELVSYAYDEAVLPLRLEDGREVRAVSYVVNRAHVQYRGGLGLDEQAAIIAAAVGPMGPNADYLARTVAGLAEIGVRDEALAALEKKVLARLGG